jgi:hypothetical protein
MEVPQAPTNRREHFCGWTSVLLLLPALEPLLVSQGLDRVEIGGLSRRVIAKADPDQSGEEYREQYGAWADGRRPPRETRDERGCSDPEHDSDEPPGDGKRYRLNQKLSQNVAHLRADGLAQSNFSRPLTDRHQHDIHNADAAHDQRDRSHSREHDRHDARRCLLRGEELL